MAAEVVRLRTTKYRRRAPHPMPDEMPIPEVARLLRLARIERFTLRQTLYATKTVRLWAHSCGRLRADWVMTTLNAMRQGWGLRGFKAHRNRFVFSWLSSGVDPDRALSKEQVEEVLVGLQARLDQRSSLTGDPRKPGGKSHESPSLFQDPR